MRYYQLSYPRSGANWLRYIARHLLQVDKHYIETDEPNDIYIKTHILSRTETQKCNRGRGLILLLRDFKECIVSHLHENAVQIPAIKQYLTCIQTFDDWSSPKLLIYYHDLILRPCQTVVKLAKFFDPPIDTTKVQEFCDSLEKHQECSRNSYSTYVRACKSGDDPYHYQKRLQIDKCNQKALKVTPRNLLPYIQPFLRKVDL